MALSIPTMALASPFLEAWCSSYGRGEEAAFEILDRLERVFLENGTSSAQNREYVRRETVRLLNGLMQHPLATAKAHRVATARALGLLACAGIDRTHPRRSDYEFLCRCTNVAAGL
jgi:hypothetical protein